MSRNYWTTGAGFPMCKIAHQYFTAQGYRYQHGAGDPNMDPLEMECVNEAVMAAYWNYTDFTVGDLKTEECKMAKSKSLVTFNKFEKDGRVFPTIGIKASADAKFAFTFGFNKAKLIVDNIDAIRKFVIDNEPAQEKKAPAKKKAA